MTGSATAQFFAAEMRRARQAVGLTQEQLSQAISYPVSLVAVVESGTRAPTADFTRRVDQVLKTDGLLERIRTDLVVRQAGTPAWLQAWLAIEEEATTLLSFEPLAVPALLQTEAYARAVLTWSTGGPDEERTGSLVAARLDRQRILARERPPEFVALLDERVLACPVGGRPVMYEQLRRLAEVALAGRVIVQVVPLESETYLGLSGAFALAAHDRGDVAYLDSQVQGYMVTAPETLAEVKRRWNTIRAEALPRRQSLDKITEWAEQWKP